MLPGGKRHYRDEFSWICSGVILNSRFILTAAHCRLRGRRMVVRVGVHKIPSYYNEQFSSLQGRSSSDDFYLDQESFILHEDFIKERTSKGQLRLKNDIALIKLDKDIVFSQTIQPVCWRNTRIEDDITSPTVVGWGKTYSDQITKINGVYSSDQLKLKVPIVPLDECRQEFPVDSGHLCAGGVPGQDSCSGDSGGGLFSRSDDTGAWSVIGIVSYGSSSCGSGSPGVYTRVSSYERWILEKMNPEI